MKRILAILLCFGLLAAFTAPALSHRLKLFATVEAGAIAGYAFFSGGGRARGADIIFRSAEGKELKRLKAGNDGSFRWIPDRAQDVKVVVNTGEGHAAEIWIAAARLGAPVQEPPPPAREPKKSEQARSVPKTNPAELAALIEQKVDVAVARQIKPLMEAYAQAEARVRFNDVMGGIGMIVGLAGIALWAMGRRRRDGARPETDA